MIKRKIKVMKYAPCFAFLFNFPCEWSVSYVDKYFKTKTEAMRIAKLLRNTKNKKLLLRMSEGRFVDDLI